MGKGTANRLFKGARLFVACTTLMLLTATVMEREDQDGYQATHLFFMPRQSWEMDGGRGMLYEEEYYHRMDLEALTEETAQSSHGPVLKTTPYTPNPAGTDLPLVHAAGGFAPGRDYVYATEAPPARPHMWQGDTRSPPPRNCNFI
jgi:hypothetical protein